MKTTKARLGELLIARGALDTASVERLLNRQRDEHRRLGELILEEGLVGEGALREALAEQHGLGSVDLAATPPAPNALSLVPIDVIRRCEAVPLAVEGQTLYVGMVDPDNVLAREELRFASGYTSLRIALITATDFARFVLGSGGGASALAEAVQLGHDAPVVVEFGGASPADVAAIPIEAPPVVSLLDHILATALRRDASEIHIEPYDAVTRVRLRVDGQLLTLISAPRRLHEPLLARLRATSGDQTEATLRLSAEGREGRYCLIPLDTSRGQKLVLKRVDHEARGLADLGLSSKVRARLSKCFAPPEGLILVTGPRDSGRTTAVSALASYANHPMRQVIFASRHGHAAVPGAISLPLTGSPADARLIERALSHNPDVLVLDGLELDAEGPRRDGPTLAAVAVRAALDGHLVIASVSAPRAADAIVRLVGSGVPAWQVAASLQAVVAQRLVRAVHEPCSAAVELSPAEVDELKLPRDALDKARLRGARGCGACYGTGFLGRTAISEVLFGAPALREAIRLGRPTEAQLVDAGRADGFATLWEDGIVKLLSGKTSLDELRAVLAE